MWETSSFPAVASFFLPKERGGPMVFFFSLSHCEAYTWVRLDHPLLSCTFRHLHWTLSSDCWCCENGKIRSVSRIDIVVGRGTTLCRISYQGISRLSLVLIQKFALKTKSVRKQKKKKERKRAAVADERWSWSQEMSSNQVMITGHVSSSRRSENVIMMRWNGPRKSSRQQPHTWLRSIFFASLQPSQILSHFFFVLN